MSELSNMAQELADDDMCYDTVYSVDIVDGTLLAETTSTMDVRRVARNHDVEIAGVLPPEQAAEAGAGRGNSIVAVEEM